MAEQYYQDQVCQWTGILANNCSPLSGDGDANHEHIAWHLEREVALGNLVRNEDGSYSLPPEEK